MKIGILGCGYVGQAAAKFWKDKGYFISATTRRREQIAPLQSIVHDVYFLQEQSLLSFLTDLDALLISVAPDASSHSAYITTYLQTSQQIVAFLPQVSKLKHILYTSSTSVYGDFQGAWVDETTEPKPATEKAECLYQTEQTLLQAANDHLSIILFRLGEIYGPQRLITDRLKQPNRLPIPGTGEQFTNVIHLVDIIRALDFALANQLRGIFNLCNDFHESRYRLYERLCQQAQLPPVRWDPEKTSPHGGNKKVSNAKIKSLGFAFLENGQPQ